MGARLFLVLIALPAVHALVHPGLGTRDEEPPEGRIVVIGGGVTEDRSDEERRRRARTAEAQMGLLAQSVLLAAAPDVGVLCRRDGRVFRDRQVNLSAVARLHRAGFVLLPTLDAPHASVVLPNLDVATIRGFRNCFDPAQPNPPGSLPD